MSLYINNTVRLVKLLLHYPSAIPHVLGRGLSLRAHINSLVEQEYMKRPIEAKNTQGFDIYLHNRGDRVTSPWIAITGNFEPEVTWLFKKVLKKGSKVSDVGANVGWFTLLAARMVGEYGLVLSFEPEPRNFVLLAKSVARNKFSNVKLFQEAVSDIDGIVRLNLHEHGDNPGAHSIVVDYGDGNIPVQSSSLETVANRLSIDSKPDISGYEVQRTTL